VLPRYMSKELKPRSHARKNVWSITSQTSSRHRNLQTRLCGRLDVAMRVARGDGYLGNIRLRGLVGTLLDLAVMRRLLDKVEDLLGERFVGLRL
jgi:hypothetical protein